MSTDTPITAALDCPEPKYAQEIHFDGARYFAISPEDYEQLYESHLKLERESARLREEVEMLNVRHAAAMLHAQTHADEYNALREELAEAKRDNGLAKLVIQQKQDQIASAEAALEQSEARALEYKTEHAALLGTSQWQEVEIADLRDDVKRLMQTVSECEERALANEKDAGRLRWLLEDHEHPATRELRNSLLNRMQVMSYSAACTDIDAAIAGAKHD